MGDLLTQTSRSPTLLLPSFPLTFSLRNVNTKLSLYMAWRYNSRLAVHGMTVQQEARCSWHDGTTAGSLFMAWRYNSRLAEHLQSFLNLRPDNSDFYFPWRDIVTGFTITLRHITLGRTPLDVWSARRRDLYLTTHNTHNIQTSMPTVGFEPAVPASEPLQTHALDRAASWMYR